MPFQRCIQVPPLLRSAHAHPLFIKPACSDVPTTLSISSNITPCWRVLVLQLLIYTSKICGHSVGIPSQGAPARGATSVNQFSSTLLDIWARCPTFSSSWRGPDAKTRATTQALDLSEFSGESQCLALAKKDAQYHDFMQALCRLLTSFGQEIRFAPLLARMPNRLDLRRSGS